MANHIHTSLAVGLAIAGSHLATAKAQVTLSDGGTYAYPPNTVPDMTRLDVFDGPGGASTTVDLLDTGVLFGVRIHDTSIFNAAGGTANVVNLSGNAVMNLSGTSMVRVPMTGDASVVMTGGSLSDDILGNDRADIRVSGGSMRNLQANDNSTAWFGGDAIIEKYAGSESSVGEIAGGTVLDEVLVIEDAFVLISGGAIGNRISASRGGTMDVTGGSWSGQIRVFGSSRITLFGEFDAPYGDYFDGGILDDTIVTGVLADGTPVSNLANITASGIITLAPIPAPGTACLAIASAILASRRKRELE